MPPRRVGASLLAATLALGAFSLAAAAASASTSTASYRSRPPSQPALKAAIRSHPGTGRASYQSVNPPSPCYYSVWGDPNEAPQLDAQAYGALFDCSSGTWSFPVTTRDSWASSQLDYFDVSINTDGNSSTGCGGFDYVVEGIYDSGSASLLAGIFSTPDPTCAATPGFVANASVGRNSSSEISLVFPNSAIGSPTAIEWAAAIKGISEPQPDLIPDSGTHVESGYGGPCTAQPMGDASTSYSVVDDPHGAAAALASDGQPDVQAAGDQGGVVRFSGDPMKAASSLRRHGIEAAVHPDRRLDYQTVPNDTSYSSQWALPAVHAPVAWDVTKGSASIVVADLDAGVDATHPDLTGKLVAGYDATTGTPLSMTTDTDQGPNHHGTATAGVIGAATDNSSQLASLGWNTSVMPIKAGDAQGVLMSWAIAGLHYAADHGAQVANLSWGNACPDTNLASAVTYAQSHGVLLVASAGNDATAGDRPEYPAAYPDVVAVGATGFDNTVAPYSNYGSYIDLVAPGGSSDGNSSHNVLLLGAGHGTQTGAGTSFSAPMVAAAAALVEAVNPALTAESTRAILIGTATDLGDPGFDNLYGYGLLDAARAVQTAAARANFNPLAPARILDTRNGTGGTLAPVGQGQTRSVKVTGVGSVPASGVVAVVLNVTITNATTGSFLTLFPSDGSRPLASNLNFGPGQNVPNLVVVKVGADGNVKVYNDQESVDVIFDVAGWYGASGSSYNAVTPARVLDTRDGTGSPAAPVGQGETRSVKVTGVGTVPPTGVSAVVLNVTITNATKGSFLTLFPSDGAKPLASNLNFGPGQNVPNLVVVKVGADGNVKVYNDQGSVDVIFDVAGWFGASGSTYSPLPPWRILDTRNGTGSPQAALGQGQTRAVKVAGVGGVPATGISAVVLNVTITNATTGSFLTLFPSDASKPLASNLNFGPGQNIPNLVVVKVGADGNVKMYNDQGSVDVIFDVAGWYT